MSEARTGPPLEKREPRQAGTEAGHLEKTGKNRSADLIKFSETLPPSNHAATQPMSFADLRRWGAHAGIPVRATLWGAGRPDNALGSIVAHFDAPVPEWLIASAIERATHIIGAPNIDDYFATAAQIAAKGGRVLLIETSTGALLPGGAASDD
jgi:hypothetical protein